MQRGSKETQEDGCVSEHDNSSCRVTRFVALRRIMVMFSTSHHTEAVRSSTRLETRCHDEQQSGWSKLHVELNNVLSTQR